MGLIDFQRHLASELQNELDAIIREGNYPDLEDLLRRLGRCRYLAVTVYFSISANFATRPDGAPLLRVIDGGRP